MHGDGRTDRLRAGKDGLIDGGSGWMEIKKERGRYG